MNGMRQRRKIVMVGVLLMTGMVLLIDAFALGKKIHSKFQDADGQTVKADDGTISSEDDRTAEGSSASGTDKNTSKEPDTDKSDAGKSDPDDGISMTVVDPDGPMVAFTFDDGPYSPVTDRIVAAFEKNGGSCTFFNLGERWESGMTDYIRSGQNAVAKGDEIATHTYNHPDLTTLSPEAIRNQVNKSCKLIEKNTGKPVALLRPPGGAVNETVSASVGKPMILWSVDTQDWKNRDADMVYDTAISQIQDGSVVLMHDLYETTATAVERLLPELKKQGYQFVTVSELCEYRNVELEDGNIYGNNTIKNPDKPATDEGNSDDASADYINYDDEESPE